MKVTASSRTMRMAVFCCLLIVGHRCDETSPETTQTPVPFEQDITTSYTADATATLSAETLTSTENELYSATDETTISPAATDLLPHPSGFSAEPSSVDRKRLAQFRLSPLHFLELNGLADEDELPDISANGERRTGRGSSYVYDVPANPFGSEDVGVVLDETGAETGQPKLLIRPETSADEGYAYERPSNPIQLPDALPK